MIVTGQESFTTFQDRREAGSLLAQKLKRFIHKQPYLLALPRGGVEVGYEIAKHLKIPLDVIISRKIAAPFNPEFALGAISEGNVREIDHDALLRWGVSEKEIERVIDREKQEMARRIQLYRGGKKLSSMKGKTIILVDDGLATGYTALAGLKSIRSLQPHRLIFAAPVCARQNLKKLSKYTDDIICLIIPDDLRAVGNYYSQFEQTSDNEVLRWLSSTRHSYKSPN